MVILILNQIMSSMAKFNYIKQRIKLLSLILLLQIKTGFQIIGFQNLISKMEQFLKIIKINSAQNQWVIQKKIKNLTGEEAKVILNQVTGKDLSKIEGALEVLGKQADLVIANPNGINLNGVKTINSSRFVATTSDKIDPDKMQLNVTKGTVTIDVNGFATDNLPYLDIVAKKNEQKGSIGNKDNVKNNYQTNITFVAGSSEYDLNKHEVTKKNGVASNDEVAITGASTGAMYGKNIKLIVTDTGAGVKHDGIILSENDIKLESKEGDIDLGNKVRAKKKLIQEMQKE